MDMLHTKGHVPVRLHLRVLCCAAAERTVQIRQPNYLVS
jgi:hypothetical protein